MNKKTIYFISFLALVGGAQYSNAQAQFQPQASDTVIGVGNAEKTVYDQGCMQDQPLLDSLAFHAQAAADQNALEQCQTLNGPQMKAVRVSEYASESTCKRFGPFNSVDDYKTSVSATYSCAP